MHDPEVVAWEIRSPIPRRPRAPLRKNPPRWKLRGAFKYVAGHELYFPSLLTVWHREPGGRDVGDVCPHWYRDGDKLIHTQAWKWHVHHWRITCPPLQELRRWLLTRCQWCGGPSRRGDRVDVSYQWDVPKVPWWRGRHGLYHSDCTSVRDAHARCVCAFPELKNGDYGKCGRCGLFRAWRQNPVIDEPTRILKQLPHGSRIPPELKPRLEMLWRTAREEREREETSQ